MIKNREERRRVLSAAMSLNVSESGWTQQVLKAEEAEDTESGGNWEQYIFYTCYVSKNLDEIKFLNRAQQT